MRIKIRIERTAAVPAEAESPMFTPLSENIFRGLFSEESSVSGFFEGFSAGGAERTATPADFFKATS